ncbi:subclass B3 metallo-beta-lactamase [Allosphingosinicella vermicomposti]|uniref:subclass B3 metallo-beta-lactamase n=1 Tax=Allosphingosinicella vermicomposti TaxID=614671 RepID=UPI000D0E99A5|nr:subclass B3 metallo-beta-lactamase [Allosphingosinicella vermicomposti]
MKGVFLARSLRAKSRSAALLLFASASLSAPGFTHQDKGFAEQRAAWNKPVAPFRIADNVYYVGTSELSAFLITDPQGHILIDAAMEESADQIAANIRTLGFKPEDIDILLVNHAHWDHSGGLAALKGLSGARLLASAADKPDLQSGTVSYRDDLAPAPPVKVDQVLNDGDKIAIGAITLVTHLTPGHTKGCTSWSMRAQAAGKPVDIIFTCSLTVAGQPLVGDRRYLDVAQDFRNTFAKLKSMKADIFLNFHPGFFHMSEKRQRLLNGDAAAFVDPAELQQQVASAERSFEKELARQQAEANQP